MDRAILPASCPQQNPVSLHLTSPPSMLPLRFVASDLGGDMGSTLCPLPPHIPVSPHPSITRPHALLLASGLVPVTWVVTWAALPSYPLPSSLHSYVTAPQHYTSPHRLPHPVACFRSGASDLGGDLGSTCALLPRTPSLNSMSLRPNYTSPHYTCHTLLPVSCLVPVTWVATWGSPVPSSPAPLR